MTYSSALSSMAYFLGHQMKRMLDKGVPLETCKQEFARLEKVLAETKREAGFEGLSGEIITDGFSYKDGEIQIIDIEAAKDISQKWTEEYYNNPNTETALRYECALLVYMAGVS